MTDDIAGLIEALRDLKGRIEPCWELITEKAADALSHLTTPPLPEGHGEPCYYCGKPCSSIAGNPNEWPIPLCHADDPGVTKWHHTGCVTERLRPAPPLPDEIAGLIEWFGFFIEAFEQKNDAPSPQLRKIATALHALAQENAAKEGVIAFHQANEVLLDKRILTLAQEIERLKLVYDKANRTIVAADLKRRIAELEAERAAIQALNKSLLAHNGALLRDIGNPAAIRAKTIEECALVADTCHCHEAVSIYNRIRALAQTDEAKT